MKKLTQKQADIFNYIRSVIKEKSIAPTCSEIAEEFGMWPNGAWEHVKALQRKGALTYIEGKGRSAIPVKGYRVRVK